MKKQAPFPLNLRMKEEGRKEEGQTPPSLIVFFMSGSLTVFCDIFVQGCNYMNLAFQSSGKMFNLQSLSKIFFYIIFVVLKSTQLQDRIGKNL